MAEQIQGISAEQNLGLGNIATVRLDRQGAAMVSQLHGRYAEQALKGRLFHAHTAASGVAPGTSVGTTAAFSLYNPVGSGYNLSILLGSMGYISGTLGAGTIDWVANINPAAAATTGTAIVPVNGLLGGGAAAAGRPLTTATLPASPSLVRPFCSLQASLASTAVAPWEIFDDVGGAIIVTPGTTISLEGTTASGSTPLVVFGVLWEEIPI